MAVRVRTLTCGWLTSDAGCCSPATPSDCGLALDLDQPPGFAHDVERQRAGFAWLRGQEAAGIQLVFSHDAAQWASFPAEL